MDSNYRALESSLVVLLKFMLDIAAARGKGALQCVAVCCSAFGVLQRVAVCCGVLQCVIVCCSVCCYSDWLWNKVAKSAIWRNPLKNLNGATAGASRR